MLAPSVPDLPAVSEATLRAVPNGAIGWIDRPKEGAQVPRYFEGANGSFLLVYGTPFLLDRPVAAALQAAATEGAADVLALARSLDGLFGLVYYDAAARTVSVHNDNLGFSPLYWHRDEGLVLIANSVTGLTRTKAFPITFNPEAWGALLRYGSTLGDSYYCREVERLSGGIDATWTPDTGALTISSRRWWPRVDPSLTLDTFDSHETVDLLRKEIEAYRAWYPSPTLLLSGGGDSRLMLALLGKDGCDHAVTVNHPDEAWDMDGVAAAALAKDFVRDFERVGNGRDYYSSEDYFDFMQLHELAVPSTELFIANLYGPLRRKRLPAFWSGMMPGTHLFPPGRNEPDTLTQYVARTVYAADVPHVARALSVFRNPEGINEAFENQFANMLRRYEDTEESIAEFAVPNRHRNRLAAIPMKVLAPYSEPLVPGISRAVFERVLALPRKYRRGHALWYKLFETHFPEYLRYPTISRGEIKISEHLPWKWRAIMRLAEMYQGSLAERAMMKLTGNPAHYFRPSTLVDRVIQVIDPGHEDLNPDVVRRLQAGGTGDRLDYNLQYSRQILFHWKVWRDQMEGRTEELRKMLFPESKTTSGS
jgi:hypothetical protein